MIHPWFEYMQNNSGGYLKGPAYVIYIQASQMSSPKSAITSILLAYLMGVIVIAAAIVGTLLVLATPSMCHL